MRSFPFVAIALACALSAPAAGQTGSEANLVFTIFGGAVTGHDLWMVDKQPLCVLDAGSLCTSQYDTLTLSRSVSSSIVVGAAATYFLSPHVGVHAELSFLGLPVESHCTGFFNPDAANRNQQLCADIGRQPAGGGAVAAFGGVTLRAGSRRAFSPYARGSVGLVTQTQSAIDVPGVVNDLKPGQTTLMLGAAVGFTTAVGTGYQFRLELRDVMAKLERLTGPADGTGIAPTGSRLYHHIGLTLGLDVVLERRRGRRY